MTNTTETNPKKTVDLPPYGDRNADPLTDSPGSHPIETGVGAALGGAASGIAIGAVAGPIGAAIGAAVGAIAGGLAGKGVGELVDPTTEDNWIREYYHGQNRTPLETELTDTRSAYRFGVRAEADNPGRSFTEVESELADRWVAPGGSGAWGRAWKDVKNVVRAGFEQARSSRNKV